MKCGFCGSENMQVVTETNIETNSGRGCGWILLHLLLTILTGGIWLIVIFIRGSRLKTNTTTDTKFICMSCGRSSLAPETKARKLKEGNKKETRNTIMIVIAILMVLVVIVG